ncbi:hypothetical protein EJB05_23399, partial [Eragrostis curvula]
MEGGRGSCDSTSVPDLSYPSSPFFPHSALLASVSRHTPMDHDDTDFQSQNFQLAGKDNSKFSSGLRPFAVPKLDIDDQLQNHLRFDSLVDSEAFFSIQGHDSSWIEALSTGSSIVDFSSSAAESCSISKANNVWSEATSTESVEMLLKSVGESEMTGNMDGNAHNQLSGMDSQIDPSNEQPKSGDSPTDSTVAPTEKDQSQSTCSEMTGGPECSQSTHSRMTEDPSSTQSQLDHFAPFSMDEKGIVNEKFSSHKTSESSPAADNYFEAVHDDRSLNRLNMPSAELGSGKLNNEPFPELAPLRSIYVTDSYQFDHVNQDSEVGVPQDSKICHIKENKVEGGLLDVQNLSRTGQPLGPVNLSNQVSNEHLLPGSSDGLLEAITNPVQMLQRIDDTCKTVSETLQPSFSPLQHTAKGMKSSADMSNDLVDKEFDSGSNSALSHQSEPNLRNSNPHHVASLSIESSKMNPSPKRNLDLATSVPEETKNAGADGTDLFIGDESKHRVLGDHKHSVDKPKIGAMEENKIREDMSEVSGNIKKMVGFDHEENTTGVTGTTNNNFDSSDNIAPDNHSADSFHTSEDPNIPSVNHEKLLKEGDTPALEERPENTHLVLSSSGPQENSSASLISSSGNISVDDLKDKTDRSEVSMDDSAAVLPDEKESRKSTVNHEEPFKEDAKSTLEDEGNIILSGSVPGVEIPAVSMSLNTDAASVAKEVEYKERTISLGGSTAEETRDKSVNHPDFYLEKWQTDESSIQSECHTDLATPSPSTLGTSSEKAVAKAIGTPQTAKENLDAHVQGTVLSPGTDHSPATVLSQGKLGSSGDGISADATCGSPPVISCTEPSPQKGGHGSSSVFHQTLDKLSENVTDNEASADVTKSLKLCSNKNAKSTLASEETNTAGDDRSFSFEVGGSPNASEKAHSPAWSPFPGFSASQSTEVITESPQPKSSGRSLNNSSDDNKKTSVAEAGKEPLPERKVTESSAGPSDNSNNGDSTKSSPLASRQHSTPECSVSSADLVNLPFTDAQHLQLRAQIFVYGALIQGTPPGEAYMVAAFGESVSGGKPTWEAAWRAAVERFQFQKSIYTGLETPTSSRIGTVSEKATKGTAVKTAPGSKKGGKTVLPAHSAVALHSPSAPASTSTFNLQRGTHLDFSQAVSPVFGYNSHMRHPSSGVASLQPSPGPRPAPWLVQPQNLIFDSSMQPAVPASETSKGQSSQSISISHAVSPGIFAPSPAPPIVAPLAVIHEEKQKAPTSTSKGTSSQKPRKRKKASASPEQQPVIASPQLSTDMVSFTPAAKHTAGFTLSTHSPSNALGSRLVPNTGQITSVPSYQITGSMNAEQRNIFSEQIHGAIEQSTGQAKGASLHSMEAVSQKESIWSHLSTVSRNKLPPEVEEKLTSAAAAAEAAVSVAKAAAEAAKMASEAALQSKMMAEEALNSCKSVNSLQNLEAGQFNVNINPPSLLTSSPASSWKIKDNSHAPGSIVSAAREVARKRVEEASAAAKRAENLDAILKAAELAAEAVFNVGTIIGMGEPLPFTLSELLEAGPNGFWKSERVKSSIKAVNGNGNPVTETLPVDVPADFSKSGKKRGRKPKSDQSVLNLEPSSSARELQPDGMQSGHGFNDVPAIVSVDGKSNDTASTSIIWNGIEKGSVIEVSSYAGGFGVAWFPAKVVDINEDGALISYDNHNEGTGPREEWVPLKLEGDKAPRIRLAHPATLSKFKTRKRRRETAGNCSWVAGDHVDAWLNDRWREGVIAQNHEGDETKFVVQFSAGGGGDSLVVDAWSLRPSLIWKDGQWTDWSRARERKSKFTKGDSPLEKRQRTEPLPVGSDRPFGGEGGPSKDKSTNNSKKPEEPKPLALSQRDMTFNVGKSVVENKTDALAFKRPGLQKEGSKVVYGVPKHGRRKKFMEVSKHYVAGQSDRISESNASSRVPKHTVPPLPRPRDNASKIDQRGRRLGEVRSRGPPKPSKSQCGAANTIIDKDSLSMPVPSSGVFGRNFAFTGSTSNTEKSTVEKNKVLFGTVPRIEDPSVSEVQAVSSTPTSSQDVPTTNRTKRKHVPSVDNRSIRKTSERSSSDAAELQRTSSDSAEPRRSNRRIQPTSRLLEGLQSSLIVSKVPGEKGPRSNFRSTTSRGNSCLFHCLALWGELMAEKRRHRAVFGEFGKATLLFVDNRSLPEYGSIRIGLV